LHKTIFDRHHPCTNDQKELQGDYSVSNLSTQTAKVDADLTNEVTMRLHSCSYTYKDDAVEEIGAAAAAAELLGHDGGRRRRVHPAVLALEHLGPRERLHE